MRVIGVANGTGEASLRLFASAKGEMSAAKRTQGVHTPPKPQTSTTTPSQRIIQITKITVQIFDIRMLHMLYINNQEASNGRLEHEESPRRHGVARTTF